MESNGAVPSSNQVTVHEEPPEQVIPEYGWVMKTLAYAVQSIESKKRVRIIGKRFEDVHPNGWKETGGRSRN